MSFSIVRTIHAGCFLWTTLAFSASGVVAEDGVGWLRNVLTKTSHAESEKHARILELPRRTQCCARCDKRPGYPQKPRHEMPGDVNRSDCPPARYNLNDWERSGGADRVACWARPSTYKMYAAGYVGGGAAIGGRCRTREEGTWGLDYRFFETVNVFMKWTHLRRPQGGEGAYATDHEE